MKTAREKPSKGRKKGFDAGAMTGYEKKEGEGWEEVEPFVLIVCLLSESLDNEPQLLLSNKN